MAADLALMTDAVDVGAIRELLGKATPMPWGQGIAGDLLLPEVDYVAAFGHVIVDSDLSDDGAGGVNDAALIVALVNNAPALLDAYEREGRLREALEEARQWLDSLPLDCNDGLQMGALAATQRRIREALPVRSLLGEGE